MTLQKNARTAGALYLALVVTGIFHLLYVPSRLIVRGDASTTVDNIVASEFLFKLGMSTGLLSTIVFVLLSFALFRLFSEVNKEIATVMVVFVLLSVPVSFVGAAHLGEVLRLLDNVSYLHSFGAEQFDTIVMQSIDAYFSTVRVNQIFWGLWLFPFGYLAYTSHYIPRVFGILLMLGCVGYIVAFTGQTFVEGYRDTLIATIIGLPASIGEIGTCLWLLIMGAKEPVQSG